MPVEWSSDQILSFSPDHFVSEAARRLAVPVSWPQLAQEPEAAAVWGECVENHQQTQHTLIDLRQPSFYCSCPSYKFPCKHVIALFLLYGEQPDSFAKTPPPGWVREWLEEHDQEQYPPSPKPVRPNYKRERQRQAKLQEGLAELELWLQDLLRQGLAPLQGKSSERWQQIAARMVDAQAANIARELQQMATIPNSGGDWPGRLLGRLGRLQLLIEGFKHFDEQPPETQADLRAAAGWVPRPNELLHLPQIYDRWNVVGNCVEHHSRLRIQHRWLVGEKTHLTALLLDYAHGRQSFKSSQFVPGSAIPASLIFYPSAAPLRAFVAAQHGEPTSIAGLRGHGRIAYALESYTAALTRNPWLAYFHLSIANVAPVQQGKRWFITDNHGDALPLRPKFLYAWHLLALSGGHPLMVFGEWDGATYLPLSVLVNGRWLDLTVIRGIL